MEESGIFPQLMVTQMIAIGEQTGSLEEMLSKIADFYEEEVDTAVDNMTALMEPFYYVISGRGDWRPGDINVSAYLPDGQCALTSEFFCRFVMD